MSSLIHMKQAIDDLRNDMHYFKNKWYLGYNNRTIMSSTMK